MNERYLRWGDIAKVHFALNGQIGGASQLRALLAQQIESGLIEGPDTTGVQGLYRISDRGWAQFQETKPS
ncbi:hypothetical protein [Bradyrhizobium liaoningense]|uniref:hypothetical protein n=1 Tax=Bradyrhizobium liaoningense TaxID=43992 RepID=UPI001BAE014E|nr:hypothetical protein [Bradyrhizobium liaoningense]MBR0714060.1 hypothetical protein [Bradyrhizobium liaoningense]